MTTKTPTLYNVTVDTEVSNGSKVILVPITIIKNVPYNVASKLMESARREFGYSRVALVGGTVQ